MKSLENKIIVITGHSWWLWMALTEILLEQWVIVMGLSRSIPEYKHPNLFSYVCDISDPIALGNNFENIKTTHWIPFGVIANASIWYEWGILEHDFDIISKLFSINTLWTIYTAQEAFRLMKVQQYWHIIFIWSTAAYNLRPTHSIYAASKLAVVWFSEAFSKEASQYGIKVSSFSPGAIDTGLFQKAWFEVDSKDRMDAKDVAQSIVQILIQADNVHIATCIVKKFP